MIDSHCHLGDRAFEADLADVIQRARAAGVERVLTIVTAGDPEEMSRSRRVSELWPEACLAVGIHPHVAGQYAGRSDQAVAVVQDALATMPRVRAIGEVGLDYHYDFSDRGVQRDVFRRQVRLAREIGLPIVVHTREATEDTMAILREEGGGEVTGVFHCFSGDVGMARAALELGFHVSFAGIVTFSKGETLREAARSVPASRLLVETDAPYLAPVPHRGTRNEPAFVVRTADALARARGETLDAVGRAVTGAFEALFRP